MTNTTKAAPKSAAYLADRASKLHATRDARKNASADVQGKMRGVRLILGRVI